MLLKTDRRETMEERVLKLSRSTDGNVVSTFVEGSGGKVRNCGTRRLDLDFRGASRNRGACPWFASMSGAETDLRVFTEAAEEATGELSWIDRSEVIARDGAGLSLPVFSTGDKACEVSGHTDLYNLGKCSL